MIATANGLAKTGTHALNKTIQLLGVPSKVAHLPYSERPDGKTVCIFRNPRNVIISWLRFTGRPLTQGKIIEQIKNYQGVGIAAAGNEFTQYLIDDSVLAVRYEELISDGGKTVEQIAAYLGVPVLDDCYPNIKGLTLTWTGAPSDWEKHWTDEIDIVWKEYGGAELEGAWNY